MKLIKEQDENSMSFKKERAEIPKEHLTLFTEIEELEVISQEALMNAFHIEEIDADKLLYNLWVNDAVKKINGFYNVVDKNKFVKICHLFGYYKLSPMFKFMYEQKHRDK